MKKTKDLVSEYTGLIPFIKAIDKQLSDPDVFVVASQTANLKKYGYSFDVSSNGSGAGLTHENAFNAAIGEAIERYGLSVFETEENIIETYNDLISEGLHPIHPKIFQPFNINAQSSVSFVEFDENQKINWVKIGNLTKKTEELIPACLINIPYVPSDKNENIISFSVSTGAACSNSLKDSIIRGIFELIERDSFMIIWRNRLKIPKVDLQSDSDFSKLFSEVFDRPGLKYEVYYTTLDMGVPSFFGVLSDNRDGAYGKVVGGAAHNDPKIAILKTLLELVQGLKWKDHKMEQGLTELKTTDNFSNINSFEKRMELYCFNKNVEKAFDFLRDADELKISDIKPFDKNNILESLISDFRKKELDVLAIDITPFEAKECGLFVTKVFIPGLEIMEGDVNFPFLHTKRWRQLPVELGLLSKENSIQSINPFPHPYP